MAAQVPILPDLSPAASLDEIRDYLVSLNQYLANREPTQDGDAVAKFATWQGLVDVGVVKLLRSTGGFGSAGGGTFSPTGGGGSSSGGSGSSGGGGSGGSAPDTTDPTPPPAYGDFTVTATITTFIVEWQAPTYTQGKGNAYTIVYAANYSGSGQPPTISDAREVYRSVGRSAIAVIPSSMGKTVHFWIRPVTQDEVTLGLMQGAATGGTNGKAATTGKIGNTDLGPLIVEAGNLANGAVTGTKLAANAVDATKFAAGLEPVTVVTSVPGAKSTATIFNAADGKLYRWNGSAYIKSVDGADIVANSITAGQIQVGAIGATQLAAQAISVNKLLVTGAPGTSIWPDANFRDPSFWQSDLPWGTTPSQVTIADGPAGSTVMRGMWVSARGVRRMPVTVGKRYRASVKVRRTTDNNGSVYLRLDTGTSETGPYNIAAGRPEVILGVEGNMPAPNTWVTYSGEWVADAPFASPMVLLGHTATAGYMEAQDIRLEEKIDGELIVDGGITANKLAANAIAVGTAAVQNGAIVNAMIGNGAIDDAKIANLSAGKLTAGSISAGSYVQSTGFVSGSFGWRINGNGTAEFAAASIRGQLTAPQIDGRELVLRDSAGNPILGVNVPLAASYAAPGTVNADLVPSINAAATTANWTGIASKPADSALLNSYVVIGKNLIPNSDQSSAMTMSAGVQYGDVAIDAPLQFASNIFAANYSLQGGTTKNLVIHQNNRSASVGDDGAVVDIYPTGGWGTQWAIPVVAGQRYCLSAYMQAHRAAVGVIIGWFDAAGNVISYNESGKRDATGGAADVLSAYTRVAVASTAPANAATARVAARKYNTLAGFTESWFWIAAPQFEAVSADATGPSVYSPGPPKDTRQLGYTGDLNATNGATFGVNVGGKITPLTIDSYLEPAAIRGTHFAVDSLRTANYAQDGNGYPTSGAKLDHIGSSLKVAPYGAYFGQINMYDYMAKAAQAIDWVSGRGYFWRGSIDATLRGGAPNIDCFRLFAGGTALDTGYFLSAYVEYSLQPISSSDNLDSMRYAELEFYPLAGGATPTFVRRVALTDRLYNTATPSDAANASRGTLTVFHRAGGALNGQFYGNSNPYTLTCHIRARVFNAYGPSAWKWFHNTSNVMGVEMVGDYTAPGGSPSGGGGGGGGGGYCPAPWVMVTLSNGTQVSASSLFNGARLAAVNDMTLEAVPEGGTVRDLQTIWAERYAVVLQREPAGGAPEFSHGHRLHVVGKGWTRVEHIRPGDEITTLPGQDVAVVQQVRRTGEAQVVSFRVEGAGTYYAAGLLCHNIKIETP